MACTGLGMSTNTSRWMRLLSPQLSMEAMIPDAAVRTAQNTPATTNSRDGLIRGFGRDAMGPEPSYRVGSVGNRVDVHLPQPPGHPDHQLPGQAGDLVE